MCSFCMAVRGCVAVMMDGSVVLHGVMNGNDMATTNNDDDDDGWMQSVSVCRMLRVALVAPVAFGTMLVPLPALAFFWCLLMLSAVCIDDGL